MTCPRCARPVTGLQCRMHTLASLCSVLQAVRSLHSSLRFQTASCAIAMAVNHSVSAGAHTWKAVRKGLLYDRHAATVSALPRQPMKTAVTSSLPMRGSTGSCARWRPSGVRRSSPALSAPMARSDAVAAATAFSFGGCSTYMKKKT